MSGRPLPFVPDYAAFFWEAGREGVLRIQRCNACRSLVHTPKPVCHYCHSDDLGVADVSGLGTVVGCTLNLQPWLPAFPPPYVVASVALDEDPRVRLTTNIVGCAPEDVRVGMRVRVCFEQHDDLWFPLFSPTGEPDRDAHALPPPPVDPLTVARAVRPMRSREKFEHKVALTGIGLSRLGRRLMVDPLELAIEACRRAIDDAGLTPADIDGLSTYPGTPSIGGHSEGGAIALEGALRLRPTWVNGGQELPGQGGAIVAAMLAVAAGLCRHVLCFRTVWETTWGEYVRSGRGHAGGGERVSPPMDWTLPFGAVSAANVLAINASHHFARYGTTRETLGWIAINARANASRNPDAIYRDPLTMDDYLAARIITTPFGLYDCDVPCDGAVAVIVSARDAASDLRQPAVLVEAVGTQILEPVEWDQSTLTHEPQVLGPAAHLWSRTTLRPADVDVALLYDGFTFNCLSWLEALGFCAIGEARDYLEGGTRIALDGELPLNTHGGQLSHGRTHGFGFVHEAVTQLRGAAGERQVPEAEVAVVTTGGLTPGGCFLMTRAR